MKNNSANKNQRNEEPNLPKATLLIDGHPVRLTFLPSGNSDGLSAAKELLIQTACTHMIRCAKTKVQDREQLDIAHNKTIRDGAIKNLSPNRFVPVYEVEQEQMMGGM